MNLTVLIAEDTLIMRNLLKYYLSKYTELKVLEAKDGIEALNIIKNNKVDFLFLDTNMPSLNGFNVANYLKNNDHKIVIVSVSSDISNESKGIFKTLGVKYFLKKPIDPKMCDNVIKKVLKEYYKVPEESISN